MYSRAIVDAFVYELCMYFGMEEALLLYVHTQYKGLCN